ncbi:hypothetical protein AMAG_04136 [Allomyces macrogynus ATCC 38327]|uniref:Uncharacterized protein n=1 Tax=Allomyces macrogynus (strain ATCC 38327) TaxID=578462 RepID=A0A0L0S7V0_ALLM3|nr:hypothetical protein AMAG_04136 [Allomyces macrogynus ATCC 38327]|eukprot:KNE58572.1 hypothetical protein AMAG_04136 [Allomyces macrogynus ATCC 38327]
MSSGSDAGGHDTRAAASVHELVLAAIGRLSELAQHQNGPLLSTTGRVLDEAAPDGQPMESGWRPAADWVDEGDDATSAATSITSEPRWTIPGSSPPREPAAESASARRKPKGKGKSRKRRRADRADDDRGPDAPPSPIPLRVPKPVGPTTSSARPRPGSALGSPAPPGGPKGLPESAAPGADIWAFDASDALLNGAGNVSDSDDSAAIRTRKRLKTIPVADASDSDLSDLDDPPSAPLTGVVGDRDPVPLAPLAPALSPIPSLVGADHAHVGHGLNGEVIEQAVLSGPSTPVVPDFSRPPDPPPVTIDSPAPSATRGPSSTGIADTVSSPGPSRTPFFAAVDWDLVPSTPPIARDSSPPRRSMSPHPAAELPSDPLADDYFDRIQRRGDLFDDERDDIADAAPRIPTLAPLPPPPAVEFVDYNTFGGRHRRRTKDQARTKIVGLFEKYGDFVHLKAHERSTGQAADLDDDFVAPSVVGSQIPQPALDAGSTPDILGADDPSADLDLPPLPPLLDRRRARGPKSVVSMVMNRRRKLRENTRELFDRMVVRDAPSRRDSTRNRSVGLVATPLSFALMSATRDAEAPLFLRVAARRIRTAAARAPDGMRAKSIYGSMVRKYLVVDSDVRDALRLARAEARSANDAVLQWVDDKKDEVVHVTGSRSSVFQCPATALCVAPDSLAFCASVVLARDTFGTDIEFPAVFGLPLDVDLFAEKIDVILEEFEQCIALNELSSSLLLFVTWYLQVQFPRDDATSRQAIRNLIIDLCARVDGRFGESSGVAGRGLRVPFLVARGWMVLWQSQLENLTDSVTLQFLRQLLNHAPDPAATRLGDPFLAVLALHLSLQNQDVAGDAVVGQFADLLSPDQTWTFVFYLQQAAQLVSDQRSVVAWEVVVGLLTALTRDQSEVATMFARVFDLIDHHAWPVRHDVLLLFRDYYYSSVPHPRASISRPLTELCSPLAHTVVRQEDDDAVRFLHLVDLLDDATRKTFVLRLLPTSLAGLSAKALTRSLALFVRSAMDISKFLVRLDVTPALLDLLPDLAQFYALGDAAGVRSLFQFVVGRIGATSLSSDTRILTAMLKVAGALCAQHAPLVEDAFFATFSSLGTLLQPHMPVAIRLEVLDMVHQVLSRHVVPVADAVPLAVVGHGANAAAAAEPDHETQNSWDDPMLDDFNLLEAVAEAENSFLAKLSPLVLTVLDLLEMHIVSQKFYITTRDAEAAFTLLAVPSDASATLFRRAIQLSAMAVSLLHHGNPHEADRRVDYRYTSIRWPSAKIPLADRAIRTMITISDLLRFGVKLSDHKMTEAFGLAMFCDSGLISSRLLQDLVKHRSSTSLLGMCEGLDALSFARPRGAVIQDLFAGIVQYFRSHRVGYRANVFRLLPHLETLMGLASQFPNDNVNHIHDLILQVAFEAELGGHPLPDRFHALHREASVARSPVDAMIRLFRSWEPPSAAPSSAQLSHTDQSMLLNQFQRFWRSASRDDVARVLQSVDPATTASGVTPVHAAAPSKYRGFSSMCTGCRYHSRVRELIVRQVLVEHLVQNVRDWPSVAHVLELMVDTYTRLGTRWCPAELDCIFGLTDLIAVVLRQGRSHGCRVISASIWRLVALLLGRADVDAVPYAFPHAPSHPAVTMARLLFPFAPDQIGQLCNIPWLNDDENVNTWRADLQLLRDSTILRRIPPPGWAVEQDSHHAPSRIEATNDLFRSVMQFWAACFIHDDELRRVLGPSRAFEALLEEHYPPFAKLWRECYLQTTGQAPADDAFW